MNTPSLRKLLTNALWKILNEDPQVARIFWLAVLSRARDGDADAMKLIIETADS